MMESPESRFLVVVVKRAALRLACSIWWRTLTLLSQLDHLYSDTIMHDRRRVYLRLRVEARMAVHPFHNKASDTIGTSAV